MTSSGDPMRVGLIGVGAVAGAHLKGFEQSGVRVAAVCDKNREVGEKVASSCGAQFFIDYRELLSSGSVDAVDVLLPHHLHEEVAQATLASGLHLLVEKPAARSAAAVAELQVMAKSQGLVFAVAENTRFVEAYQVVQALLDSAVLGDIEVVRTLISGNDSALLGDARDWRGRKALAIGGALFDGGAHSFYLLEWLFGGPRSVLATGRTFTTNSEVEDFAVVTGDLHGGGSFVTEFMFAVETPWSERLEVYGNRGSCVVDQLVDPVVMHYRTGQDWTGSAIKGVDYDPTGWKARSIAETAVSFVHAVRQEAVFGVDTEHVRRAAADIECAYRSIREGTVVVTVAE